MTEELIVPAKIVEKYRREFAKVSGLAEEILNLLKRSGLSEDRISWVIQTVEIEIRNRRDEA